MKMPTVGGTQTTQVRKKKVDYNAPEVLEILEKIPHTLTYRQASEEVSNIVGRRVDASNLYRFCKRRRLQLELPPEARAQSVALSAFRPESLRLSQLRGESLRPSVLRDDSVGLSDSFRSENTDPLLRHVASTPVPNESANDRTNNAADSQSDKSSFLELASMILQEQRQLRSEMQRIENKLTSGLERIEAAVSALMHGTSASTSYIAHEPEDPSNIHLNYDYDMSVVCSSRGRVLSQPLPLGSELFDFVMSRGKCPALRVIDEETNSVRLYRQGGKGRPGTHVVYYRCSRCDGLFGKKDSTAKIKFIAGRPATTIYPTHHVACEGLTREKADELQEKRHQKAVRRSRAEETNDAQMMTHHEDEWA